MRCAEEPTSLQSISFFVIKRETKRGEERKGEGKYLMVADGSKDGNGVAARSDHETLPVLEPSVPPLIARGESIIIHYIFVNTF